MAGRGTGRWAALLAASFLAHLALTVNSTDSALWNSQSQEGSLVAQQLADASAPLALARDMVSLSVLASHYEGRPAIRSVRLYNNQHELLAETGSTGDDGRLFTASIHMQQQALGTVELRLSSPSRADIVRHSMGNILISALLHGLIFLAGLFLRKQTTVPTRGASPATTAIHRNPAAAVTVAAASAPSPATGSSLLHIALDDSNGLLTRVNAGMADELLSLLDQFVDRAARLYGGEVSTPFSTEGVLVRFQQENAQEREFHALAAGRLFLQLIADSMEERRQYGRLCLGAKVGVLHELDDAGIAAMLAQMAPPDRILSSTASSALGAYCRFSASYRLDIGQAETLQVALVEAFASEYLQLINNQSQQILGPTEAA
ncbi:MAG: hypothetical protein ACRERR_01530 [Moraxellaceae bacterium]